MSTFRYDAFVFATRREAAPFLDRIGALPERNAPCALYRGQGEHASVLVLICGMGPASATTLTRLLLNRYRVGRVCNGGAVGSLTATHAVGTVLRVQRASLLAEGAETPALDWQAPAPVSRFADLPAASLVTLDRPLFDSAARARLAPLAQLVDMEGAAIALACRELKVQCDLVKVVSDAAEDRSELHANLDRVSEALAQRLARELDWHETEALRA